MSCLQLWPEADVFVWGSEQDKHVHKGHTYKNSHISGDSPSSQQFADQLCWDRNVSYTLPGEVPGPGLESLTAIDNAGATDGKEPQDEHELEHAQVAKDNAQGLCQQQCGLQGQGRDCHPVLATPQILESVLSPPW